MRVRHLAAARGGAPPRRRASQGVNRGWPGFLALDVTVCPQCGGRLRLIATLTDPASIRRYLQGVGFAADPPSQQVLVWAA